MPSHESRVGGVTGVSFFINVNHGTGCIWMYWVRLSFLLSPKVPSYNSIEVVRQISSGIWRKDPSWHLLLQDAGARDSKGDGDDFLQFHAT